MEDDMPEFETVEKVPDWATCYVAYGDDSGLDPEDKAECDAWLAKLAAERLFPVAPEECSESEFEPFPAFGKACGTVDWTFRREAKPRR